MVGAIWVKRGVNGSAADLLAAAPAPVQFAGVRHSLMHPVRTQQILRILHRGLLGLACLVPAARARGQAPNRPLDVHVIDETGMRVPAVLTLLLDRAGTTIRRGVTDSLGRTLLMAPAGVPLTVQVRHLGYAMAQRNVLVPLSGQAARAGDTAVVTLVLRRVVSSLDTVRVTAQESLRRRIYHIDSTTIATSTRTLFDAWDVLTKLRPDIAYGRGFCPGVHDVWINGEWIPPELVSPNDMAIARARARAPSTATPHLNAQRSTAEIAHPGMPSTRDMVVSLLSEIPPEDIAEMTFHACGEAPMPELHTDDALFITLKPGLGFDPGRGVYRAAPPD